MEAIRKEINKTISSLKPEAFCSSLEQTCVQGPPGIPGSKGSRGERGPAGSTGQKGSRGFTGHSGESGIMGPPGEKGAQGEKGSPGPRGYPVAKGDVGPSLSAPTVVISPMKQVVKENQSAIFQCLATGNPKPSVSWVRSDPNGTGHFLYESNGTLEVRDVSITDAGKYTCFAKNLLGAMNKSAILTVEAPPRVQLASGPTHAKIGRTATLPRCNVTGYPVPVVTWRKLGGVLATERAVYGERSLSLVGARKTDTGLYQCRAKNNLGESSALTTLVVWTQPKLILRPPSRVYKKTGQNLLLNCKATPLASVFWRRVRGDWIADRMKVKNGTLEISSLTQSDSGSYVCEARLLFYTIRATTTLRVDLDECQTGSFRCHARAVCVNVSGSYSCRCRPGYVGNGKTVCEVSVPRVRTQTTCSSSLLVQNANNQSGLIQSSTGTIYSYRMNCSWTITSNAALELAFVGPFKTERNNDFVYVYDGSSASARLIGRFSGSSRPGTILSSSNQLHVRFTSDSSSQYYGFKAVYRVLNQGSVRLRGGGLNYGRVEIFYNDTWGTVCDDGWDINDAHVVCRQLGFPRLASNAYTGAHYGQGTGPIWMDDVACSGSESHLYECRHRGWGSHDCTHSGDSSVVCRYGSSYLRLAGGSSHYGRVEVYYKGEWGTVCDDSWDINDAHVVCRQLGFSSAAYQYGSARYGQGSGRIWLDNVGCQGGEVSLSSCSHNAWGSHNCGHSEDASVVCATN
ncbi:uncharacterized protein LOC141860078 [Acropora palmata]|uniref:uncharacterized protein LOC141860078 n=1 Tax=Acropora palmata TaxID=6131 RepID=UPI003DA0F272